MLDFQDVGEIEEIVKTGLWIGDCFIYTNSVNRLNYYVGGEIVTIAHLDRLVGGSVCELVRVLKRDFYCHFKRSFSNFTKFKLVKY